MFLVFVYLVVSSLERSRIARLCVMMVKERFQSWSEEGDAGFF